MDTPAARTSLLTQPNHDGDAPPPGVPVVLRVEEAATLLRIGRSTAYELIRTGQLDSIKIGGARRVPRSALDDFVERLRR